jgi:hypothetical protein
MRLALSSCKPQPRSTSGSMVGGLRGSQSAACPQRLDPAEFGGGLCARSNGGVDFMIAQLWTAADQSEQTRRRSAPLRATPAATRALAPLVVDW